MDPSSWSVESSEDSNSSSHAQRPPVATSAAASVPQTTTQRGKRRATGKQRRRTAYPMYAIAKERSIEFNLNLDINSLRQELQNLTQLRELLAAKALLARDALVNSSLEMIRQFYTVFRRGYQPPAHQQQRVKEVDTSPAIGYTADHQAAFLAMMMDEHVDCGNGLFGRDVVLNQFRQFSTSMTFLSLDMQCFTVIDSDDSVIIRTTGLFRARLLRKSITTIFPRVLAHEDLVRRLVGHEIECPRSTTFTFNSQNQVYSYRVEIDFIAALSKLLVHPVDVAIVMGSARIVHSMLCIEEDSNYDEEKENVKPEVLEDEEDNNPLLLSMVESIGELPSLVAHGDDDDDDFDGHSANSSTDSILPIEVAEIFNFKE
uniref:Uncharacterized protein n=1 Tax=Globisporangium ultimum (strain ATCC 200006 / CBS 805.95 / DAOM BR144) TaxID=431595 RepID=K3W801_GLOUD